tara:strand:- start:1281 stop:2417 length:1137 start_codon:yes stop_codon:yes gene_type:complete
MAIIYTYPELKLSDLTKHDLFIITDVSSLSTANSTKSLSLDNLVRYVKQSSGGGTGTANKIPKFKTTGSSILEDSIMTQNGSFQIDLAGNLSLQPTGVGPSVGSYSIYFRGVDDTGAELNGGRIFTIDSQINPSGQDLYFQNADDNGILRTNLVIDAFGSVGVATTLPSYTLDVNGTGNFASTLNIGTNATVGADVIFSSYGSGTKTGTATYSLAVTAAGQVIEEPLPALRKIFTATSLDTTTNYNVSPAGTQTPIVWDSELIKDSIYTHDNAVNPEQVTVTEAGTYRIYSMLTATSAGIRVQVLLKIAINGTARARFGAQMYIRSGSGQNKSSSTIEETIVLNANDIITITGERGSSIITAVYNISEASYFSIEKIA